ncbi:DUF6626 family protein [Terasakiella sp.]|uniref:DUF6626 family protein n=1 Tax=Terasakiella sp. TaxID=2034861 RepID=UPI003AA7C0A6
MIIKVENLPLHEEVFEFLRANYYLADAADLSRKMGRSRSYMASLRYSSHEPSGEAYRNLKSYLQECLSETDDADLQGCLNTYIARITCEVLS